MLNRTKNKVFTIIRINNDWYLMEGKEIIAKAPTINSITDFLLNYLYDSSNLESEDI